MRLGSSISRKLRALTAVTLAAALLAPVQAMAQKKDVTT